MNLKEQYDTIQNRYNEYCALHKVDHVNTFYYNAKRTAYANVLHMMDRCMDKGIIHVRSRIYEMIIDVVDHGLYTNYYYRQGLIEAYYECLTVLGVFETEERYGRNRLHYRGDEEWKQG